MNELWVWALVAAGLLAVGDWVAVARAAKEAEYLFKPGALAALLVTAALIPTDLEARRSWIVVALALSMMGDVFLMLPTDRFVAGLGAFLVAHICYVVAFTVEKPPAATAVLASSIIAAAIAGSYGSIVLRHVVRADRALVVPVAFYMVAIAAMVATAGAAGISAALGAASFLTSDCLIARHRFVAAARWQPLAIIVLYHLGQAGLVLSLL